MFFVLEYLARIVFRSFWPLQAAILVVLALEFKNLRLKNLLTALLLSIYFLINHTIGTDFNIPIVISLVVLTLVGLSSFYSSNLVILSVLFSHLYFNWQYSNDLALYGTSFITQTALLVSSAIIITESRIMNTIWLILLLLLGVLLESRSMQVSGILMFSFIIWKRLSKGYISMVLLVLALILPLAYGEISTTRLWKSFNLEYLVTNDIARMYMNMSCLECLSQNLLYGCLLNGGISEKIYELYDHRMVGHGLIGAVGNFGFIGIGYYLIFYKELLKKYTFIKLIPLMVFGLFHDLFLSPIFVILLIRDDNSIVSRL